MGNNTACIALFLLATPTFAQHGGGARSGTVAGFGHGGGVLAPRVRTVRPLRFSGNRLGFQRFGGESFAPYDPFWGDYAGDLSGYDFPADADYLPANDFLPVQLAVRALPAHAVVTEYKWKDQGVGGSDNSLAFTIALKDGTRCIAVATWLQHSKLYYIDSQGRQEVLSSDRIDRDTTQRLNDEKKLQLQLPPG
jgi:hypothetical protein